MPALRHYALCRIADIVAILQDIVVPSPVWDDLKFGPRTSQQEALITTSNMGPVAATHLPKLSAGPGRSEPASVAGAPVDTIHAAVGRAPEEELVVGLRRHLLQTLASPLPVVTFLALSLLFYDTA